MFWQNVSYSGEASTSPISDKKVPNALFLLPTRWFEHLVLQIDAVVQRLSIERAPRGRLNALGWLGKVLGRRFERHKLRRLSDRQLIDAGIDLSHAGRGRAVAVDPITITNLGSLR